MGLTTIKISDRAWLALKQVQVEYKKGKSPECRTFWALLDAIGVGNDELLALFRRKMKEGKNEDQASGSAPKAKRATRKGR